jgi:hypothetical protein
MEEEYLINPIGGNYYQKEVIEKYVMDQNKPIILSYYILENKVEADDCFEYFHYQVITLDFFHYKTIPRVIRGLYFDHIFFSEYPFTWEGGTGADKHKKSGCELDHLALMFKHHQFATLSFVLRRVCFKCKKADNLMKCSACGVAYYCSRECQCADWKIHKKLCNHITKKAVQFEPAFTKATIYCDARNLVEEPSVSTIPMTDRT